STPTNRPAAHPLAALDSTRGVPLSMAIVFPSAPRRARDVAARRRREPSGQPQGFIWAGKLVDAERVGSQQQAIRLDQDRGGFQTRAFWGEGAIASAAIAGAVEMEQQAAQRHPNLLRRRVHADGRDDRL